MDGRADRSNVAADFSRMKTAKLIICVVSATLGATDPARARLPHAGDSAPIRVENVGAIDLPDLATLADLAETRVAAQKGAFPGCGEDGHRHHVSVARP